jgi:hypothetical protein
MGRELGDLAVKNACNLSAAARRTRHCVNKIRRLTTCPNIAPTKPQYGSSGFICAFHCDLWFTRIRHRNMFFARDSRALIYICRCCTAVPSESWNPQRLSAPCSKLSMWHSDTTLMSPMCCVFVCPLSSADRHIGSSVRGDRNAVEQVLLEKLIVTQPIRKLPAFGTAWMPNIVLARDNHWAHPQPADCSQKSTVFPVHAMNYIGAVEV